MCSLSFFNKENKILKKKLQFEWLPTIKSLKKTITFWVVSLVYLFSIGCGPATVLLEGVLFPIFFCVFGGRGEHGKGKEKKVISKS